MMTKGEKGGPVNYVALGDSTGVGVGAQRWRLCRASLCADQRVACGFASHQPVRERRNHRGCLRGQVGPALTARPTLVTLGIGINDVGRGVSVERFARNYEEIVTRLRAKTNAPIVVTNCRTSRSLRPSPSHCAARLAGASRSSTSTSKRSPKHGLLVVDAYTATHELIPQHPEFFSTDGFHPSDDGLRVLGQADVADGQIRHRRIEKRTKI